MRKGIFAVCLLASVLAASTSWFSSVNPEWGFFGHRRLNRLAVFTLDQDMMPFFRSHIEWLTEHAVDPDKRRYASKHEAVRHYIDLDHWGEGDFAHVPRRWTDALIWKADIRIIQDLDTTLWNTDSIVQSDPEYPFAPSSTVYLSSSMGDTLTSSLGDFRRFWINNYLPNYYEEERKISPDSLAVIGINVDATTTVFVSDRFGEYGILPYHLEQMHRRITQAFIAEDANAILRLCAEMGHYLGDAHVPLHTTENYNGQLTGQTGIHAFWESRIPELFADEQFDYLVGKAEYIEDPRDFYWGVVLESHALVDSVLNSERRLRQLYPADQQMVFDERSGRTVKIESPEFAEAWNREMQGMVEERFRASILAIGSAWFTCWVDAGQPDLDKFIPSERLFSQKDTLSQGGKIIGRSHE